jgi:hypothetical protein
MFYRFISEHLMVTKKSIVPSIKVRPFKRMTFMIGNK